MGEFNRRTRNQEEEDQDEIESTNFNEDRHFDRDRCHNHPRGGIRIIGVSLTEEGPILTGNRSAIVRQSNIFVHCCGEAVAFRSNCSRWINIINPSDIVPISLSRGFNRIQVMNRNRMVSNEIVVRFELDECHDRCDRDFCCFPNRRRFGFFGRNRMNIEPNI